MSDLNELEQRATSELQACGDESALRAWNTKYFGDSGEMKKALAGIGTVPKDQRAAYGKEANRIKEALTAAFDSKLMEVEERAIEESLAKETLDVTLPGRPVERGRLHIATQTLREVYAIFADSG